jgi:hypothetical protein
MIPSDLRIPGVFLTPDAAPALARAWQVGQVLEATVLARAAQTNTLTLRVGNVAIEAQSQVALRPGENVKLQVVSLNDPARGAPAHNGQAAVSAAAGKDAPAAPAVVVLRVVTPEMQQSQALAQGLRSALARQRDLGPLLATLTQHAAGPAAQNTALPASIAAFLRELVSRLPRAESTTTPGGLRQSVENSGMLLESRLAQGGAPPANDFKAALLKLQARIQGELAAPQTGGTPPGALAALQRDVAGALARIQLNQLAALPTDRQPLPAWALEVPVRDGGELRSLRLGIEPEAQDGAANGEARRWSIWLSFEPGALGPVHCHLAVSGDKVSADFWAERAETAQLFSSHLTELEAGFTRDGLSAARLHCQAGIPPRLPGPRLPEGILSERA